MAEGTGLLNRHTGNCIESSNLFSSAKRDGATTKARLRLANRAVQMLRGASQLEFGSVAQWIEHRPTKPGVGGSSPPGTTIVTETPIAPGPLPGAIVDDAAYMRLALQEAHAAGDVGDVPVGCVIVMDGTVVGSGRNRREQHHDPTAHAEVEALRMAAAALGTWRIEGTLYVTQEPCVMCAGAVVNARVKRLVYGCPNPKAGGVLSLYRIVDEGKLNHRVDEITGGVLADECAKTLKEFFAKLRQGPAYR